MVGGKYYPSTGVLNMPLTTLYITTFGLWKCIESIFRSVGQF